MTPVPHTTTTDTLANRFGGNKPLPVTETFEGIFASAWVPTNEDLKMLRSSKKVAITLVVDTNVPGHPSVSLKVQRVQLIPD